MSFFDDASLVFLPSGQAGKDAKAYSMKPTDGSGDFTFSRGSNLTATRVDSNGLIEKGRENLLLQSNQFDTTWVTSNASVTSGQNGYDGSSDAWLLENTLTSFPRVEQSVSQSGVVTCSVYAKAGTNNIVRLIQIGGSTAQAYFNLSDGTIANQNNVINAQIESVGNSWYRCSITFDGSTTAVRIYSADGVGSFALGNIYIQDAQLEQGLVATEYIESGATTGLAGILEDSPRFDYSGGASCPSLLLEPSRTNLIEYSEYFEGSIWETVNLDVKNNNAISPEGVQNAAKICETTTTNTKFRLRTNSSRITSGDNVLSIYAKAEERTWIVLREQSQTGVYAFFNLSGNGSVGQSTADNPTIEPLSDGWYKCSITDVLTAVGMDIRIALSDGVDSYDGVFGNGLYVYGAQIEQGSYPTSYIPNHSGGSVTREADDSTLSSIINGDAAFTFMIESGIQDYGSSVPKYFDAGALGYINHNTSNILRYRFGGSNYVQSISGLDSFKFLLRYDRSEIKVYFNGSLEHTISASLSGSIGLSLLGGLNKQVLLFPTDLPLNQCITLTS